MYVKKFISFCQVLKKMHTKGNWFLFSASHCVSVQLAFFHPYTWDISSCILSWEVSWHNRVDVSLAIGRLFVLLLIDLLLHKDSCWVVYKPLALYSFSIKRSLKSVSGCLLFQLTVCQVAGVFLLIETSNIGYCLACANLHKRGLAQSPSCDCDQRQTVNHTVNTCPLTTFEGGLNLLREADDDAVIRLVSTVTAALVK